MLDDPVAVRILAEVRERDLRAAERLCRMAATAKRRRVHRWPRARPLGDGLRRTVGTLRVTLRARRRAW